MFSSMLQIFISKISKFGLIFLSFASVDACTQISCLSNICHVIKKKKNLKKNLTFATPLC